MPKVLTNERNNLEMTIIIEIEIWVQHLHVRLDFFCACHFFLWTSGICIDCMQFEKYIFFLDDNFIGMKLCFLLNILQRH